MKIFYLSLLFCISCADSFDKKNTLNENSVDLLEKKGEQITLEGKLFYKKYEWAKTGENWDNVGVNFFLSDKNNKIFHIVGSDKIPEEQLHTFNNKNVVIKVETFTDDFIAEPKSPLVYPIDEHGNPLKRPLRYRVLEIKNLP